MVCLKSTAFFERLLRQGRDQLQQLVKSAKLPGFSAKLPEAGTLSPVREVNWVMGNEAAGKSSKTATS